MRRLLNSSLIAVAVLCSTELRTPALSQDILGAGSTFVYPVLAKWTEAYRAETGVKISYQAVGSSTGIWQIKSRTVDFGASDAPLRPDELDSNLNRWRVWARGPATFGRMIYSCR